MDDLLEDAEDAVRLVRGTLRRGETGEVLRERRRTLSWTATEAGLGSVHAATEGGTAIRIRRSRELLLVARSGAGPEALREVLRGAARRTGGSPFLKAPRPSRAEESSARGEEARDEETAALLSAALSHAFHDPRGLSVSLVVRRVSTARAVISSRAAVPCGMSERLEATGTLSRPGGRRPFSFQSSRRGADAFEALSAALAEAARPRTVLPPPSGPLDVVLSPAASAVFWHEAVGHMLEADGVSGGGSVLARVVGAAVAPPGIDVWDEPSRDDLPGAYAYDDEGTLAEAVPLVEDGVVRGLLTDRRSAGAESNGHGRAADWREAPRTRMSNLVVRPGAATADDLLERCGEGLVVHAVSAGAADPESGRFYLVVEEAQLVRRSRAGPNVSRFVLSGDVLAALSGLDPERGDTAAPGTGLSICVKGSSALAVGGAAPSVLVRGLVARGAPQ